MQLDGIRVIDLTRILSGPFCSMFLADMGADVVKVEDPDGGDPVRHQGEAVNGFSLYFASFNRNKRSITLNLRSEEGKQVLRDLLETADVVIDNYRPGVMDRMGFGREALRAIKPDLIVCHVTGFGMDGPYRDRPSFDFIAQAMSGFMAVNGDEDGPPQRAGPPISDMVAGSYAAMGVLAALVRRGRTGQGEEISTALTDSMTSMLAFLATNHFATGREPQRTGNDHALVAPYGLFEASDGQVAVAPSNDAFYLRLLDALGLQSLREREEYRTNAQRFERRAQINAEISAVTRTNTVEHWIARINAAGVPCGRVLSVKEVFEDPQVKHQQMRITIDHPVHGKQDVLGFPIKFTDDPCRVHRHPPVLGEHTDAVLASIGRTPEQIAALRAQGAV